MQGGNGLRTAAGEQLGLEDLERRRIGGNFFSRKNTVFKSVFLGRIAIVKVFGASRRSLAEKEFSILRQCRDKGVSVPAPIELREEAIVMEFVEGITLADALDRAWLDGGTRLPEERVDVEATASAVGEWLADFHDAFGRGMSRGDSNARNFLVSGDEVVGVDFEEATRTDVLDDIGQICSSVLSLHPMFTHDKFDFCRKLADAYFSNTGDDRSDELWRVTAKALKYYSSFRSDPSMMLEMADEMERTGLFQTRTDGQRSAHLSI